MTRREQTCGGGVELDGNPIGCGVSLLMTDLALERRTVSGEVETGYRCVDCETAFCKRCIRLHFERSNSLEARLAATAAPKPEERPR